MNRSRTHLLLAVLLVPGALVVALWIRWAGGPELVAAVQRLRPAHGLALVGLTASCVFLRFLRWQYLLRRLGVRVPTRPSLVIYLASLAGIATPAYVGETLRCVLLRRQYGVPVRVTLPAWFVERLADLAAIALLGLAALTDSWTVLLVGLVVAAGLSLRSGRGVGFAGRTGLLHRGVMVPVLAISVLAWLPAVFIIGIAAAGLSEPLGALDGVRVFTASTLGGGLSLMPAGMAATGSLAIVQLEALGLAPTSAVAVTSIFRIATAGLTLAIGGGFMVLELRRLRRREAGPAHFDAIADDYLDQFSPHIWDLLLARKTALIESALGPPADAGMGLDLGCGLGLQARELSQRGYRVLGLDPAYGLLRGNPDGDLSAIAGSALELPFRDGSLDFVYTVGVLHHLPDASAQRVACAEIARVLRPGGVLVVHETNPRNPLFRLYMSYLFPILRSIDEGIEHWIDPGRWAGMEGFQVERIEFFTFLPDFLPRWLLRAALGLEKRLESGPTRVYSVHYMAVVRRSAAGAGPRATTHMLAAQNRPL